MSFFSQTLLLLQSNTYSVTHKEFIFHILGANKEDEPGTLNHVIIGDSGAEGVGVGITNEESEKETKSECKDECKEAELEEVDKVDKNEIAAGGANRAIESDNGSVLTDETNESERHNKDSDKDETEERDKEEVV